MRCRVIAGDLLVATSVRPASITLTPAPCLQLWLELARAFLSDDSADDAQYCVDRALLLSPGSAAAHHVQGCIHEVRSAMRAQHRQG